MWRSHRIRARWLVPCRNLARRKQVLVVAPTSDGRVALILPDGDVAILEMLAVGRLRGALREAVYDLDHPYTALAHRYAVPVARITS
jgi:hypothetical protein